VERVTGIGGVFIRSALPAELRAWYAQHLGLDVNAEWGGAVLRATGGETLTWAVFPRDTDYFGGRDQQAMVNYRVADVDAMLSQLRAAGVAVDERVEEVEFGRFGWAVDPDGNRFEVWERRPVIRQTLLRSEAWPAPPERASDSRA
jgi:predicted enzyme related to lactoylglutathione lyase